MKNFLTLFICVSLAGCASARLQRETKDGGHVQIFGHRSVAAEKGFEKAKALMSAKCPGGFEEIGRGVENSGSLSHDPIIGGMSADEVAYIDFKCR